MNVRRFLPLTGIAAVALLLGAHVAHGSIPHASASADAVASFYRSHSTRMLVGSFLMVPAAFFTLLYAVALSDRLPTGMFTSFGKAGGVVLSVALALIAALGVALGDAAKTLDPVGIQALNAAFFDLFAPLGLGAAVFLVGYGVAVVRGAAVPKWLGWGALPFGVLALMPEPVGDIAFLGLGIWVLVSSALLALRVDVLAARGSRSMPRPSPGQAGELPVEDSVDHA